MLNFQVPFYTIGHFDGLSEDTVTRTAHVDVPDEVLAVAASLQSARQWLLEQHPGMDMDCSADVAIRGYYSFGGEGFHAESAQLVVLSDGFVARVALDNGVYVETDLLALPL